MSASVYTPDQISVLENLKTRIESMDKMHHIEILKLLKKSPQISSFFREGELQ